MFAASLYCVCSEPLSTPPSLGKLLSYLHKITFGKHLPCFASVARLPRSLNASSRDAAWKDELCQDSWALQAWITGCYSVWCPMLRYPVVSLRNICQCVLLGSLEGLSCLCQELVCWIIFPGMIQHLAQQPARLCPCKVSRVIPWDVAVPGRGIWRLSTLSM